MSLSPDHPPVATVASGTEVVFETKDCFSDTITSEEQLLSTIGWDAVNPATGPVAVEGAEPGDTLKVEILDIVTAATGTMTTHPDFGALPGTVEERTRRVDVADGMVRFDEHLSFPVNPMVGVISTPAAGEVPTGTPGDHGGNMDTPEIRRGTTLYLPVNVPGAMLAIGDGHCRQGEGEVCVSGLEIAAEVTVRITLIKGAPYPLPFLLTDGQAIAIASRPTLDEAAREATRMMQGYLAAKTPLDATDATMLLSLVGDLKISQIVDPVVTARMELPRTVLESYGVALV